MGDEIWPERPKTEKAGTAWTEDVDLGCVGTIRTRTRGTARRATASPGPARKLSIDSIAMEF
eukprot:6282046-Pyramimonas_sp.AAC.1